MRDEKDFLLVHPPIGDIGGIQTFVSDVELALGSSVTVAGSKRPVSSSRAVRLLIRLQTFMRSIQELTGRRSATLLVAHVSLVEYALFNRWFDRTALIVYGRELESCSRWKKAVWNRLLRADKIAIVTISEASRTLAKELGWATERWVLIQPVVSDHSHRSSPKPRQLLDPLRVVTVSRLDRASARKNIDVLIEAVSQIATSGREIQLTVIGDGNLRSHLEQQACRVSPKGVVEFLGFVSAEDKGKILGRSDCFALPSTQEGFGLVVLEAWQHGLAVIGSSERSLAELIEDGVTGLTPDPTVQDVASALESLYDESFRLALASAGSGRFDSQFGLERLRRDLRSLASSDRGKRP